MSPWKKLYQRILSLPRGISGLNRGMIWILPVLAVLIPVTVWWQIQQSVLDNRRKIQTLASRHQQVLPLVEKILAGQKSRQEDWSDLSAMTAVQQLVRDVDLQSRLVSIAPVGSDRESQGVKIFLQNLNLIQMLAFFQGLGDQTGLFIVSGSISKSRDNQKLADLNLVLSR